MREKGQKMLSTGIGKFTVQTVRQAHRGEQNRANSKFKIVGPLSAWTKDKIES